DDIFIRVVQPLEQPLLFLRQLADHAMQKQCGLVEPAPRRFDPPLTTTLRAIGCNWASSSEDSSVRVKTTTGRSDSAGSSRISSSRSNPDRRGKRFTGRHA